MGCMDKIEWNRVNRGLQTASSRLTAELRKLTDKPQLSGLDAAGIAAQQHSSTTFAAVADARQHLSALQRQITQGQYQQLPCPISIQDLAAQISKFTELLISLKLQQRNQYSSLLKDEQELIEEISALQFSLDSSDEQYTLPDEHCNGSSDRCLLDDCPYSSSRGSHPASKTASDSPSKRQRQSCSADAGSTRGSAAKCTVRPSTVGGVGNSNPLCQQDSMYKSGCSNSSAGVGSNVAPRTSSNVCGSTLLPEVVTHDAFLARYGDTGGWHPDDHKVFLAVLRSSRGDYSAAVAAAVDALPGITRQQIIAHSRWHADLTELDMRRRVALVNWRSARNAAKAARQAEAAILQDTHGSAQEQQPPDQRDKESRQLRKHIVAQWKADRLAAQEQQAARAAEQWRQQQEREQAQLQRKRAALKQQLEAAKAVKQQQAAARMLQGSTSQVVPGGLSAGAQQHEVQRRLAERNTAAMHRRQQLLAAKQDKQAAREKAQQQILAEMEGAKPRVSRDPGRLLSATAAAAARAAQAAEEAAEKQAAGGAVGRGSLGSGFVLHLGHKAVPSWASGMRL